MCVCLEASMENSKIPNVRILLTRKKLFLLNSRADTMNTLNRMLYLLFRTKKLIKKYLSFLIFFHILALFFLSRNKTENLMKILVNSFLKFMLDSKNIINSVE